MADIYQWRRRIQPSLSRSTTISEQDETDLESTSGVKKSRLRPKFSTYFSHHVPSPNQYKSASFLDSQQVFGDGAAPSSPYEWPEGCDPNPDQVMDSIMRKLMAEPYRPLDIKHNSSLLMIFETYRALRDHNLGLVEKLTQEVEARYAARLDAENDHQRWQQEREEYKAEVKRLELIIARGKGGMAGVMQARRGSIARRHHRQRTMSAPDTDDDHRETVFEFLERTRAEDEAVRRTQRAVFRTHPISPSQRMAALSHKFSTTSHHQGLPFDSPPSPQEPTTLSQASYFENICSRPSLSDTDSFGRESVHQAAGVTLTDDSFASPDTNDVAANGHMDGHEAEKPFLLPGFQAKLGPVNGEQVDGDGAVNRKPKPRPETLHFGERRRFSFELDDDTEPTEHPARSAARFPIQRSVSLGQLAPQPTYSPLRKGLGILTTTSPSPTLTTPSAVDSPHISKIPSPVFDPSLARPRREDSTSSFLTAIRAPYGDPGHSRTTSRSSNPINSPHQSSREDFRSADDNTGDQRGIGRYGSMYELPMAVAAARAAAVPPSTSNPMVQSRGPHSAST